MPTIALKCPLCDDGLTVSERTAQCPRGHSFDQAKQGHWNLLPVQNKKSKSPGDDRSMLAARRRFLDAGHYQPLVDAVGTLNGVGLDLGSGEGWYARALGASAGIDIAKDGVRMAASRQPQATWVVGSALSAPFESGQFDWVLSIFAPFDQSEVKRLLKPGGEFIQVGPGPGHLRALAELIYDEPQAHVSDAAGPYERVCFEMSLGGQVLADLHHMTPYYWSTPADKRASIEAHDGLKVTADFTIRRTRFDG